MARALRPPKLPVKLKVPRLPNIDEEYEDVFEEMTLAEHLDEFRSRLVKTCVSVGLAFLVGLFLAKPLLRVVRDKVQASQGLDILSPTDPFVVYMKVALYIAVAIAAPVIMYQMISFLAPGLTRKEKRVVFSTLPFVSILFIIGALFAFLVAAPRAFTFLSNFGGDIFDWTPNGPEVINFYLTLMIGMGLAFELPVVMFTLAKLHIVSGKRMAKFRRYAVIVILIAAAIITPTPDPFNMMVVALPIYVLYEIGLLLARTQVKRSE
ncbi:MAG TPA: twin-arginine translocase subunit TatC [Thermomicrobiales bacterium]|nr:twin-arginine translocase subunit TatC [Thermomicrobiales bacterium]